jgi:hypothetical protein
MEKIWVEQGTHMRICGRTMMIDTGLLILSQPYRICLLDER